MCNWSGGVRVCVCVCGGRWSVGKILTFFRNLLLVVTKVVTVSSTLFVCARVLSATGSLGMPGGRSTASCCLFLSLSKNDGIVLFTAFFYFEEEKKEMIQL